MIGKCSKFLLVIMFSGLACSAQAQTSEEMFMQKCKALSNETRSDSIQRDKRLCPCTSQELKAKTSATEYAKIAENYDELLTGSIDHVLFEAHSTCVMKYYTNEQIMEDAKKTLEDSRKFREGKGK